MVELPSDRKVPRHRSKASSHVIKCRFVLSAVTYPHFIVPNEAALSKNGCVTRRRRRPCAGRGMPSPCRPRHDAAAMPGWAGCPPNAHTPPVDDRRKLWPVRWPPAAPHGPGPRRRTGNKTARPRDSPPSALQLLMYGPKTETRSIYRDSPPSALHGPATPGLSRPLAKSLAGPVPECLGPPPGASKARRPARVAEGCWQRLLAGRRRAGDIPAHGGGLRRSQNQHRSRPAGGCPPSSWRLPTAIASTHPRRRTAAVRRTNQSRRTAGMLVACNAAGDVIHLRCLAPPGLGAPHSRRARAWCGSGASVAPGLPARAGDLKAGRDTASSGPGDGDPHSHCAVTRPACVPRDGGGMRR